MDSRLKWHLNRGTLPKTLLVVGPAGTGKTFGLLTVIHCLARQYPKLRILFLRQTRASLSESVLPCYEQEILPRDNMEWLAEGARRENRTRYQYPNGTDIVLGGMDKPTKVLSTDWDIVFFNEAIEARQEAWETLASRMARPNRDPRFGFLIGDTNPGAPDHWLLSHCQSGLTTLWDTCHQANPALHDGHRWTAKGERYLNQLRSTLTGTRRARLLEGLWAVGEGLWFDGFDAARNVSNEAEYDPALPAYLAVDPGVHTGAVFFQVRREERVRSDGKVEWPHIVTVFGDYFSEGLRAEHNAAAIRQWGDTLCGGGKLTARYCDPAGGARTVIGETAIEVYAKAGLPLDPWDTTNPPVADSLALVEQLVAPIDGNPRLLIHPRCGQLIRAFQGYSRAKRKDQWTDKPEDPQHPYEDMIDALRGGLHARIRRAIDRIFL